MTDWVAWLILAGVLVAVELFTGTFYLLMISLGFIAGGIAALAGGGISIQFALAAIVGVIATYGLRRSRWGRVTRRDAYRDPNVNLDIGQTLNVDAWSGSEGEVRTARVMYRGALWDVELEHGAAARPGAHVIRAVHGNRLVVANSSTKNQ
ncbi:NfeD family protein [Herbaspirillum sp. HC18]|nr:NfeD family protein [Herbaspirillum sp. HC18]